MKKLLELILGISPTLIILILIINSCKHDNIEPGKYPAICFTKQILPIFTSNCARPDCHDQTGAAGLVLDSYEGIITGIKKGDANGSSIYKAITNVWDNMMPPDRPLPQELRTLLYLWIEQGAENDTTCVNDTSTTNGIVSISSYGAMDSHNVGQNCRLCHINGGTNQAWYVVAGTVYDSTLLNPYPNAIVRLFTQPDGQGALVAEIQVDGKGNFYSTETVNFAQGLFPTVNGINGEYKFMTQSPPDGACNSCHNDTVQTHIFLQSGDAPLPNDSICYLRDVHPVLISNCAISGCHDNTTHASGYYFNSYIKTMASQTVDPFNPSGSLMYQSIIATEGKNMHGGPDKMPPAPKNPLSQDQIDIIFQWINEGAINMDCSEQPCDLSNVTYSGVVGPIIQNNCKGCHSGTNPSGNLRLESYSDVKTIANNGKLIGVINAQTGYTQMPPGTPLNSCRKDQITLWVNNGGNNN